MSEVFQGWVRRCACGQRGRGALSRIQSACRQWNATQLPGQPVLRQVFLLNDELQRCCHLSNDHQDVAQHRVLSSWHCRWALALHPEGPHQMLALVDAYHEHPYLHTAYRQQTDGQVLILLKGKARVIDDAAAATLSVTLQSTSQF